MHKVICSVCGREIISKVINDNTLGSVLIELAEHANISHNKEYVEYGNSVELLKQVLPAYQFVATFVDYESTEKLSPVTAKLINECETIVSNTLGQTIEILASEELPKVLEPTR
jgi:hypothetical protein